VGWRRSRRRYLRWLGRGGRFYLAFAFTVAVVSYVAVPFVARVIDAIDDYNPIYYEPKDFAREEYLEQKPSSPVPGLLTLETLFKVGLLVAVVVVWRVLLPGRPTGRTSIRR
jgi:hypothetical protein